MRLREWLLDPDAAPVWVPLLVLFPVGVLAAVVITAVSGPWWTVPIPVGVAAAIWQTVAARLRARGGPTAE